jgi:hypothetical protein
MKVSLCNPTGRKTQAHIVTVGDHEFYFSYETCVAYRGPDYQCRIPNHWGPTTERHFREMGLEHWPMVDEIPNPFAN